MHIYVDESGDQGTQGRGSRWLVLAGIVDMSCGDVLLARVQLAKHLLHKQTRRLPHFQKIKKHRDKRGVLEIFSQTKWDALVVASETIEIPSESWLDKPSYQYNYAMRYLLERASRYADLVKEPLHFIIEESGDFDLEAFREYVRHLRSDPTTRNHMFWEVVSEEHIVTATRDQRPLLCVADGTAHAFYKALEPEPIWGHHEIAYADAVSAHLWGDDGARLGSRIHIHAHAEAEQLHRGVPLDSRLGGVSPDRMMPLLWHRTLLTATSPRRGRLNHIESRPNDPRRQC